MSPSSPQNDQALIREELVAYLDGELAPTDCDRIEKRLAEDETYLQELQGMDAAWSALDELPTATVDQSFTQTTIAMVTAQAQQDVAQQTAMLPRVRRRRKGLIALACCGAIVAGFISTRLLSHASNVSSNVSLIADLPVIELVDVYSQVPDVDFLLALERELGSERLAEFKKTIGQAEIDQLHSVQLASPTKRMKYVVDMEPEGRAALLEKQNKFFLQMNKDKRQQMRDLHAEIQNSKRSTELQTVLLAYRRWLSRRTPGDQAELRQQPASELLTMIRRLSRKDLRVLTDKEVIALRKEVLAFPEKNRERIVDGLRQRFGDRGFGDHGERIARIIQNAPAPLVVGMVLRIPGPGREEVLQQLASVLEKETQQRLQKNRKKEGKVKQMVAWIRQAFPNQVTPEDLEDFFVNELSNNEREKLLAMPWHEMEDELTQRLQQKTMGGPKGSFMRDLLRGQRLDHPRGRRFQRPYGPESRSSSKAVRHR